MAAASNTIGTPLDPPVVNTGYNPEQNVGAAGLYQYATQVATANQTPVEPLPPRVPNPPTNTPITIVQPRPNPITATPVTNTPVSTTVTSTPTVTTPEPIRNIELPIPVWDGSVVTRPINTHPQRYIVTDKDWTISAKSEGMGEAKEINPIVFQKGQRPELKPVLKANGIIVKAGNDYLVSPETLAVLNESRNPHYDISENGRILNVPMGKTIPIVEVNLANLPLTGSRRDIVNGFAGVKSVDYIYETPETIAGIPVGIVDQINYTLNPDVERPEDTFQIYNMALTADYSIEQLTIKTMQVEGQLDKTKLEAFMVGVKDRLNLLRKDFNIVKSIFYKGVVNSADVGAPVTITKRATSEDTEDELQRPQNSNYTITTSTLVSTAAGTGSAAPTTGVTAPAATTTPSGNVVTPGTTVNSSGGQNEALIARWQAYGWSPSESEYLKGVGSATAIMWTPSLSYKARVVVPIVNSRTGTSPSIPQLGEYYGTGKSITEYIQLNTARKNEVWQLGQDIKALEHSTGKTY